MSRTRMLLESHPEVRAIESREKMMGVRLKVDAEDFNSRTRRALPEFKRKQAMFMKTLQAAENDMYS